MEIVEDVAEDQILKEQVRGYIETGSFFGYESFFMYGNVKKETVRSQNYS